ncbi:cytochrome c maturation protein CcmE [Desulfohalovibrio reitneri]|uniref:cytochrome c maturation protein CcmE n=1 Tax=Desulfohalovibrio reitneri TaxID=1307759 RepID=UPI0004A73AFA|nr:cytochrome c maturation protein CcmE [Desulfohalovibrio reitneri]
MSKKKSPKSVYLAAAVLFVGGLGWLLFSGLSQDGVYFVNVSEALAVESSQGLDKARLFGQVLPGDLERKRNGLGCVFTLADKDNRQQTIRVDYTGAVPDTFEPGVEVIVEGGMRDGIFRASNLMTKCPSKYEEKREEEKGAEMG